MLNNSFIFSFFVSLINTIALYVFNKRQENSKQNNNDLIISFFVTFATCFVFKTISNKNGGSKGVNNILSTKPPF